MASERSHSGHFIEVPGIYDRYRAQRVVVKQSVHVEKRMADRRYGERYVLERGKSSGER